MPARVGVPDGVVWQKIDGLVLLLELGASEYYSLDDVGSQMWEMLHDSPDVSAARERLLALYEIDERTLDRDLSDFIARLSELALLSIEDALP